MKNGHGEFYWEDGSTYKGDFKNNNIEGKGTYKWADGKMFVGEWEGN